MDKILEAITSSLLTLEVKTYFILFLMRFPLYIVISELFSPPCDRRQKSFLFLYSGNWKKSLKLFSFINA